MKKIKCFLIIIMLCFSVLPLTGCYDAVGIENLAYAVALGIDEGTDNNIKLSLQFAVLGSSGSSASDSSQSDSSTVVDVECSTIDSGISLINSYMTKKINLSHCKAIVISEKLAYQGISELLYTLLNKIELRPDCNVIISKCDAYDFLSNSTPTLESVSARYYELILNSSEYSGYTEDILFSEFSSNLLSTTNQAIAILGGINNADAETDSSSDSLDENYKAGDTPLESNTKVENMGLAVFNGDTLVGELNNIETLCHLIVSNKLENATITVPSPFNYNDNISIYIGLNKSTSNEVKIINDYPYIKSKIYITGNVLSLDNTIDLSDEETLLTIENYVNTYLEENISSYLYKTAKDFKSDIDDFGKYLLSNYLTWDEWISSDWLNNYENSFFDIDVNTTIQSGYLFTKI